MSNLLKRLFGSGRNDDKTLSALQSTLTENNQSILNAGTKGSIEADFISFEFSNDDDGRSLNESWMKYYECSANGDETQDVLKNTLYLQFADKFYKYFSSAAKIPKRSDRIFEQMYFGHPVHVIVEFAIKLMSLLVIDDNIDHEIPSISMDFAVSDISSKLFISTLKCLSIISYWSNNTKVLYYKLGENFCAIILGIMKCLMTRITLFVDNPNFDSVSMKTVDYYLKCYHLCVVMISSSFNNISNAFIDSLPDQPWILTTDDDNIDTSNMKARYDHATSFQSKQRSQSGNTSRDIRLTWKNIWITNFEKLHYINVLTSHIDKFDDMRLVIQCNLNDNAHIFLRSIFVLFNELLYTILLTAEYDSKLLEYPILWHTNQILRCCNWYPLIAANEDRRILTLLTCRRNLICMRLSTILRTEISGNQPISLFLSSVLPQLLAWLRQNIDDVCYNSIQSDLQSYWIQCTSLIEFQADFNRIDIWPWTFDNPPIILPPLWRQELLDFRLCSFFISNSRSGEVDLWYRKDSYGLIWQSMYDALYDDMVSPASVESSYKEISSYFETTLTMICSAIIVTAKNFADTRIRNDESFRLPFFELHTILFLTRCLRFEPEMTSAVIQRTSIIQTLLKEQFFFREEVDEYDQLFESKISDDSTSNLSFLTLKPLNQSGLRIAAYLTLNDALFFFLQEYFSTPTNAVHRTLKPTDELMSLIPALIGSKYDIASRFSLPDHFIVQVSRFFHKIFIGYSHQLEFCGLPEQVLRSFMQIMFRLLSDLGITVVASVVEVNKSFFSQRDQHRPFLWSARSSIVSLFQWFSTNCFGKEWIDIFAGFRSKSITDDSSTAMSRTRSDSFGQFGVGEIDIDVSSIDDMPRTLSRQLIALLLIDPRIRYSIISIIINLIITMSSMIKDSPMKSTDENTSITEFSPELLPYLDYYGSICKKVLELCSNARSYPSECDLLNTFIIFLRSLTWLLRNDISVSQRKSIQNLIASSDFPKILLASVSSSYRISSKTFKVQHDIMRQTLSFYTALSNGNLNIRPMIDLMLASSYQNNDLLSLSNLKRSSHAITKNSTGSDKIKSSVPAFSLKYMILQIEPSLSIETIAVIFEMMLELPCVSAREDVNVMDSLVVSKGLFYMDEDKPQILNPKVIHFMCNIFNHCDDIVQVFILKSMLNLTSGRASSVNTTLCCQIMPTLIDVALDLFYSTTEVVHVELVKLVSVLGQYNISVSQMKHLFYLLQDRSDNRVRPAYVWRLLQSLRGMFSEYDGPRHAFVFDYLNSGLLIPSISKWPSKKGLTISLWFRLEAPKFSHRRKSFIDLERMEKSNTIRKLSIASSNQPPLIGDRSTGIEKSSILKEYIGKEYSPYLVSLRNQASGSGIDIVLRPINAVVGLFQVVVNYYKDGVCTSFSKELKGLQVTDSRWHFLAVSLQFSAGGYYHKPEASILLDDIFAKGKFLVTELPNDIEEPMIGECPANLKPSNGSMTTFRGQMGAIYFFGDALSEGHIRSIYGLGPQYFYSFEPYTIDYRDVSRTIVSRNGAVDPSSVLDGYMTSLIILAFNPTVTSGDYFIDNTPSQNNIKWKASAATVELVRDGLFRMNAKRIGGTTASTKQDVRMALDALGGVAAILPLFLQMDLPRTSLVRQFTSNNEIPFLEKKSYNDIDTNIFPSLLELIITVLENTLENKSMLKQLQGFNVIGSFFEEISPKHFSADVLDLIVLLYHRLKWDPFTQESLFKRILCNFNIWSQIDESVQHKLLDWMLLYQSDNATVMRNLFGVDNLFKTLLFNYDYINCDEVLYSDRLLNELNPNIEYNDIATSRIQYINDLFNVNEEIRPQESYLRASAGYCRMKHNLSHNSLLGIRKKFFNLLHRMIVMNTVIYPDDVRALASYIVVVPSAAAKVEGINFLRSLLNDTPYPSIPPYTLLGLTSHQSLKSLLVLLGHHDWKVRLSMLTVLMKVISLSAAFRVLPSLPSPSSQQNQNGSYSPITTSNTKAQDSMNRSTVSVSNESNHSTPYASYAYTLSALGIEPNQLTGILIIINSWFNNRIVTDDLLLQEWQCSFILRVYQLTMYGLPCEGLERELIQIINDNQLQENSIKDNLQRIQRFRIDEATICVPHILPAILNFLKYSIIPLPIKAAIMVDVKAIVQECQSCDQIFRLPYWYDYVLQLMRELLVETRSPLMANKDNSSLKIIDKVEAIADTCFRLACETISQAMSIGYPLNIDPDFIRLEEVAYRQLSLRNSLNRIRLGERNIGGNLLFDFITRFQTYDFHDAAMIPKYINSLVIYTLESLKTFHSKLHSNDSVLSDGDSLDQKDKRFGTHILFVNLWMTSVGLLCFLSEPSRIDTGDITNTPTSKQVSLLFSSFKALISTYKHTKSNIDSEEWMRIKNIFTVKDVSVDSRDNSLGSSKIGGLHWVLMRIAVSLLSNYISNDLDGVSTDEELTKCREIIRMLNDLVEEGLIDNAEYMKFEIFHMVASIFQSIHKAKKSKDSIVDSFILDCSSFIIKLVSDCKDSFEELIMAIKNDGGTDITSSRQSYLSRLSFTVDSVGYSDKIRAHSTNTSMKLGLLDTPIRDKTRKMLRSSSDSDKVETNSNEINDPSTSDSRIVSKILNELNIDGLNYKSKADIETMTRIWHDALESIEDFSQNIEFDVINKNLSSLGVTSFAFGNDEDIQRYFVEEEKNTKKWLQSSCEALNSLIVMRLDELKEHISNEQALRRNIETIKVSLLQELQNERGPWGDLNCLDSSEKQLFWLQSNTKTNCFISPRLTRNPFGTQHTIASQRAMLGSKSKSNLSDHDDFPDKRRLKNVFKFKPNPLAKSLAGDIEELDETDENQETNVINQILISLDVQIITPATNSAGAHNSGTITLSKSLLTFTRSIEQEEYDFQNKSGNKEFLWACRKYPSTSWKLTEILSVIRRRYQLREVGIEIFFSSRTSVFLNLHEIRHATKLYKFLLTRGRCVNLIRGYLPMLRISNLISMNPLLLQNGTNTTNVSDDLTLQGTLKTLSNAWTNREISNFDYLMYLNVLAGRSFNDLSQYPIFPWVIADYTSQKLDLRNPATYRDLKLPIGAQNEQQRKVLQEKYEAIASMDDCPPYHYGSHYSTLGFVLWYLIRIEPYTSLCLVTRW